MRSAARLCSYLIESGHLPFISNHKLRFCIISSLFVFPLCCLWRSTFPVTFVQTWKLIWIGHWWSIPGRIETTTPTRPLPTIRISASVSITLQMISTSKHTSMSTTTKWEEVGGVAPFRPGPLWTVGSLQKVGVAAKVSTTTNLTSGWMPRSFLGRAQRIDHLDGTITLGAVVEGEDNQRTGSPRHTENMQRTVMMMEGELWKQGEIRPEKWRKLERKNKREQATVAKRGQEEVGMELRRKERGRKPALTEGSKSLFIPFFWIILFPCQYLCTAIHFFFTHTLVLFSSLFQGIAVSSTSQPLGPFKRRSPGKTASTVRTWTTSWTPNLFLVLHPELKVILIHLSAEL